MANKQFEALKTKYDLEGNASVLVDTVGSYPITIILLNNTLQIKFEIPTNLYSLITPAIEIELKSLGFKKPIYKNKIMTITVAKKQNIVEMYNELKNLLGLNISKCTSELICPYCHHTGCNSLALKDNQYRAVHDYCHKLYATSIEKIDEQGSIFDYFKGGIGALIGAILPMLLALLLIILFDKSFGWLYVLSAVGAVCGYKLMKGSFGNIAVIISFICCFLAFVIFLYATCFYYLFNEGYSHLIVGVVDQLRFVNGIIVSPDFFELFGFESIFFVVGLILMIMSRPFSKKRLLKEQHEIEKLTKPIQI